VSPEYYGLLMFAQAAPAGSRVLKIAGLPQPRIRAWATQAPDGRTRVVVINYGNVGRRVALRVPHALVTGPATLTRLLAPSIGAADGVTLGGQTFGSQTSDGLLAGAAHFESVNSASGGYVFHLPAASAAMLTITRAPKIH
jgi:hypothetical protein